MKITKRSIIIIVIILCGIFSKKKELITLNRMSEITVTIRGKGKQDILRDNSKIPLPNEMIVNNCSKNSINHYIENLVKDINIIIMRWNKPVTDCSYMFAIQSNITEIDLRNFDTSKVTNMECMFCSLPILTSLNLSHFNTSSTFDISYMFYECLYLKSLDLSTFDTSKVTDLSWMFYGCLSLEYLNLNNIVTSKVTTMSWMFAGCSSLLSLDLSSFDTSNVTDFSYMFNGCRNLKSLNLTNFETSNATIMVAMFQECSSLLSLNLSSFNTSNCNYFFSMFENCSSLISLDLRSFITTPNSDRDNMFKNINQNLVLCYNETNANITFELKESNKNNCTCYQNSYKFLYGKNRCIDSCSKDTIYKMEYENICYQTCPNGTHVSPINNNICEKDLECKNYYNYEYNGCIDEIPNGYYLNDTNKNTIDKCQIKCEKCSSDSKLLDLCISCNESNNYFPIYNQSNNNNFFNCYNNLDGYYLDKNIKKYKPCFQHVKSVMTLEMILIINALNVLMIIFLLVQIVFNHVIKELLKKINVLTIVILILNIN